MAEGTKAIKSILWATLALGFIAWILSIIGLAGLQRDCYGNEEAVAVAARGLNASNGCTRLFSYYWFMIALQLVSLVGLTVLSCMRLLAASGLSWLAWFTVLTILFLQGSDTMLGVKDAPGGMDNFYSYAKLASAGWILTTIANFAITFLLGWRPRKVASSSGFGK